VLPVLPALVPDSSAVLTAAAGAVVGLSLGLTGGGGAIFAVAILLVAAFIIAKTAA
jgi:uncharacterized membrane protein YfcA